MVLAAHPEERLLEAPQPSKPAAKHRFALILLICFLLHAIPISLFVTFDRADNPPPAEQEIPVEIIVEPPPLKKPDPPPVKSERKARQAALDEKEATDAPRASKDEKVQRESEDRASHAPQVKPEPAPADAKPANDPAPTSDKAIASKTTDNSAPKLKDDRADGEPVKAAELQRPEDQRKAEQAAPQPEKHPTAEHDPPATFAAMPDYSFAPASRYTPVAGGHAASTYLSIVYGMVTSHMRLPKVPPGSAHGMGEIDFDVDYGGALFRARLVKTSGAPEIDAAALAAIRAAAPFPMPPTGSGLSLRFRYKGK